MFWGKEADLLVGICRTVLLKEKDVMLNFFFKKGKKKKQRQNPQNAQIHMDIERLTLP